MWWIRVFESSRERRPDYRQKTVGRVGSRWRMWWVFVSLEGQREGEVWDVVDKGIWVKPGETLRLPPEDGGSCVIQSKRGEKGAGACVWEWVGFGAGSNRRRSRNVLKLEYFRCGTWGTLGVGPDGDSLHGLPLLEAW